MGSLKLPIEQTGTTTGSKTLDNIVYPVGRAAFIPEQGDVAVHDGATPGGLRLRTFLLAATGAVRRWIAEKLMETPSVKDFGAKGDNATDDYPALQAAVDWATLNRRRVRLPAGTYKITQPLRIYRNHGWGIIGDGPEQSIIKQYTNNVPVITCDKTGDGASGYMHSVELSNLRLTYATQQVGNSSAACLLIPYIPAPAGTGTSMYLSQMHNVVFEGGYDGIKVEGGQEAPWGNSWSHFRFVGTGLGLTGHAMDWSGTTAGTPGNWWGRMVIEMGSMTDVALKQIRGFAWTIESLEFLGNKGTNASGGRGNPLISFQAGSGAEIGALKLETFAIDGDSTAFSSTQNSLIYAPSCVLHIGTLSISGNIDINSGNMSPSIRLSYIGGAVRDLTIGYMRSAIGYALNNFTWLATGGGGMARVGYHSDDGFLTVPFTDIANGATADALVYERNERRRLSADLGNADYNLPTDGGPNVLVFQTALTAPRTVELNPSGDYTKMYNGFTVTVLSRGAVNGANTITIKSNGITKATITADNTAVELTWRRAANPHTGWVVTRQGAA
ncbi:glycoside hydrolase family 55 protein [Novosphingobium huizhouense]|uniref:glycoside hydrolase family 55 protein n=1 Tax=Novosphingobium huizhouense TaxID=2866625 RepID=UPI001CD83E13|nr:glycoside hydrolase family 55 protein [Novosphingobium huizhouense]